MKDGQPRMLSHKLHDRVQVCAIALVGICGPGICHIQEPHSFEPKEVHIRGGPQLSAQDTPHRTAFADEHRPYSYPWKTKSLMVAASAGEGCPYAQAAPVIPHSAGFNVGPREGLEACVCQGTNQVSTVARPVSYTHLTLPTN
eukprot:4126361-Ditylum_brightwellii.AAC.1